MGVERRAVIECATLEAPVTAAIARGNHEGVRALPPVGTPPPFPSDVAVRMPGSFGGIPEDSVMPPGTHATPWRRLDPSASNGVSPTGEARRLHLATGDAVTLYARCRQLGGMGAPPAAVLSALPTQGKNRDHRHPGVAYGAPRCYLRRYVMRPRVRSYGETSTLTRSPGFTRM